MSQPVDVRPGIDERLARMIRLETVSAELETRGLAPFHAFRDLVFELYPHVAAELEFEQIGDLGLLYRWRGRSDSRPLILMAHYDVVPAYEGEGWSAPPFEGRIEGGIVRGRGALDDKGSLLIVLEAVENLLASGYTPTRDIYLAFGGDEESHGKAGRAVSDTLRERGVKPWMVLDEGGAVVDAPMPFLKVQSAMVGLGEKGVVTLKLTADSVGGHASAPTGLTAAARIARAVDRLDPNPFPKKLPKSLRAMLRAFAPRATGGAKFAIKLLSAAPWLTARVFAKIPGEPAALIHTTVAPTMLAGGTAHNVLPAEASAIINLRIAFGETVDSTVRRVKKAIKDPAVRVSIVEGNDPSPESPLDERFDAIARAVSVAYPGTLTAPYLQLGATDSRWYHLWTDGVYRFSPITMTAAQRASIHGLDEWVETESLLAGERFHREFITGLPE
ncbi:M20/M25/M40 family metallo-hydrolase [Agromyces protaetiae]|uniref:M20/M25/M40 family metallo-hydrolase n=1 Tax=Agromyces protaetiae TaxID=2509455 RepID=A0A4P6FHG7_9MICO|nr:M20/M25/M40 family metallo-hydrolase [Agromyces protaetiae]QAY73357.1 M20/M25/M40 family metallo-hydrolase [Agromyces protaetiae]